MDERVPAPVAYADLVARGEAGPRRPASPSIDLSKLDLGKLRAERSKIVGRSNQLAPPITRFLAVPRAIPLGGTPRVVSELRLRHLAELQAYLEEAEPNPLDGFPPAWADPEPTTRLGRLAAAWEASAAWPVRLGTDRASKLLASIGGRAFFLGLCLRDHDPGFGLAEALELLPAVTPAEWSGLYRVAYAIHPRQEIAAELAPDRSPDKPIDWVKSLHLAAGQDAAATYPALGELTLSQWRALCGDGKAMEFTPEYSALCKRVRAALEGGDVAR